jgi:hypothetical protein
LLPGGLFFVSLYNPAFRIKQADGNLSLLGRFIMENGKRLVVSCCNTYSESDNTIAGMQFYEIYGEDGGPLEKRVLNICFSAITQEDVLKTAESAGFQLKEMYGDYSGKPFTQESRFMHFLFGKG